MLRISVLGSVEISRDGRPLKLPTGKTSELLVRLAVDAGTSVRSDRLIEDLWAGAGMRTQRNTLQSKISQLRRAVEEPDVVVGGDGGYRLAVDPSAVDALEVLRRTSDATRLFEAGERRRASELCRATLTMYRGDVLAGAGDWAAPHRARLEAARLTLLVTDLHARLELGDPDVVGDAEAAIAEHPYQEGLWVVLITALYRAGRQVDALAAHQRIRRQLADELGLLPGPSLTELEHRILVHDPSLARDASALGGSDAEPATGNLPSMSPDLVGRDHDIARLGDLLTSRRLVEVTGPGGIGKTAVAIATGRTVQRPDGVWLARLEMATTADDVVDAVIAALGVTGGELALIDRLRGTDIVLILDNCEHVLDAVGDLAVRLLDAAPELRLLCTTQAPLEIDGETLVELAPLSLADAVELFTRRAGPRARQGIDDTPAAVHDLCRSLDGLPLAIELAAARTRTLSIDEIGRRLDDRFAVLHDPTSRKPERRRALGATIRWSYDLLFPDDQRGLWALATFPGGATVDALEDVVAALAVPAATAIDIVGRLASRSLLVVDDTASPHRHRLLDSIRAFALDAMAAAGDTDVALGAQARWYAGAAAASTDGVRSQDQAEHLELARSERANIDAALTWAATHEPPLAVRIAIGFGWAWVVLGDGRGAQRLLTALDAARGESPNDERATALLLAAWIEASTGNLEPARTHIAAATDLAETLDDDDLRARCCYYLAYVVSHDGDFRRALELTDRARDLYDRLDRPWDQAATALFAARAAISAGDEARSSHEIAGVEHWLSVVDDPWLQVRRDAMLGEFARLQRRFTDAVDHIARAAAASRRRGYRQTEAYQIASLGRAQCQAGDHTTGAATLRLAVDKAEAVGDVRMAALARVHLGRVLRAIGDPGGACAALESAADWHRRAGGGEQARLGECLLAAIDAAEGRPGSERRLTEVLDAARAHDEPHVEVFALDALAGIAAREGRLATERALRAEADRRMKSADHFITDDDRVDAAVAPAGAPRAHHLP